MPGIPKAYIDGYADQVKPHFEALIEDQLKEMTFTQVIMMLWVRWKPAKSIITLGPEDVEDSQGIENNMGDNVSSRDAI